MRGKLHSRGESRRADYILYHQPNLPIAVIEAKDNKHSLGSGMQQALDVPFVFSSNGDGFLFHDRSGTGGQVDAHSHTSLDRRRAARSAQGSEQQLENMIVAAPALLSEDWLLSFIRVRLRRCRRGVAV
ncbi:type I restriction-modification system, R subunit [Stutzerimonas stutzeri TS44]|nr:type I restriction-modification system, R subunit [Stutzerimonas stutzeri TS44]